MDQATIYALELAKRLRDQKNVEAFNDDFLTPPQRRFVNDKSRYKIAMCSRRAGKSVAIAHSLIKTAIEAPGSAGLYIGLTRRAAKAIVWPTLIELTRRFGFKVETNLTDLSMVFANGSRIELSGAENERQMGRLLGRNFRFIAVDEAQNFGPLLEELITRILAPMLIDDPLSQLAMCGTPPPKLSGPFVRAWLQSQEGKGWSPTKWTLADNTPMLRGRDPNAIIAEEAARRGVGLDDPTIQRELMGRLVQDESALIFPLKAINLTPPPGDLTHHVIGVDIGFDDPTALVVLGWNEHRPNLYLVHAESESGLTNSKIQARLERLHRQYRPQSIVGDTGGGGKLTIESMNEWFASVHSPIFIKPAEKPQKNAAIANLGDLIRVGQFHCAPDSQFAEEAAILEWAYDNNGRRVFPNKLKVFGRHFDVIHAALYAVREAQNLWVRPDRPKEDPSLDANILKQQHLARIQRERDPHAGLFGNPGDLF